MRGIILNVDHPSNRHIIGKVIDLIEGTNKEYWYHTDLSVTGIRVRKQYVQILPDKNKIGGEIL